MVQIANHVRWESLVAIFTEKHSRVIIVHLYLPRLILVPILQLHAMCVSPILKRSMGNVSSRLDTTYLHKLQLHRHPVQLAHSKYLPALARVSIVRRVFLAPGLPLARSVQLGNTKQVPRAALLVRRARSRPWPATRRARPASTESPWREPLHARSVARANSGRAPARARRVRPAPGRRPGR